jgi:hypothetical protein
MDGGGGGGSEYIKGQCPEIFCFWFFSWVSFPPAPEYPIRINLPPVSLVVKGTVSRDFRLLFFSMNQFPPSP